jgi:hypothetical protein
MPYPLDRDVAKAAPNAGKLIPGAPRITISAAIASAGSG